MGSDKFETRVRARYATSRDMGIMRKFNMKLMEETDIPSKHERPDSRELRSELEYLLSDKESFVKVCEYGDRIAGMAVLTVTNSGDERYGRMHSVYTAKGYRNRGVGTASVRSVLRIAQRLGCTNVRLECPNNVVSFYERFNFNVEQSTRYGYQMIWHPPRNGPKLYKE